jgi:hypothetical protein
MTRLVQSSYGSSLQSMMGPGDRNLDYTEISGSQPANRVGEVTINAFVDAHEWTRLPDHIDGKKLSGARDAPDSDANATGPVEYKPLFYEWATVREGMICVSRKKKRQVYPTSHLAAQSSVPVIACCACLGLEEESDFVIAGVARSKSVRTPDDGVGPRDDEYFTLTLKGVMQILNNGCDIITNGDLIEWCFAPLHDFGKAGSRSYGTTTKRQAREAPRRIAIRVAPVTSSRVIGRALSYAAPGQRLDVLVSL